MKDRWQRFTFYAQHQKLDSIEKKVDYRWKPWQNLVGFTVEFKFKTYRYGLWPEVATH